MARIIDGYAHSTRQAGGDAGMLWGMIGEKNQALHRTLVSRDQVAASRLLYEPAGHKLFYGFDNLFDDFVERARRDREFSRTMALSYFRRLIRLAEATGVQCCWNPEGGALFPYKQMPPVPNVDELIDLIGREIGIELDFPNPFEGEFGLRSSRGIVSERALHAIYQAYRLRRLSARPDLRVLEVGAGLGRTAYYARKFDITDYTIVDIPMTSVAQAMFLGTTLGAGAICLAGESPRAGAVRLLPPEWIDSTSESFDVVLNVDSLTEIPQAASENYAAFALRQADLFLSINHEANEHRVARLECLRGRPIDRFPYWLRDGYVEEIIRTRG